MGLRLCLRRAAFILCGLWGRTPAIRPLGFSRHQTLVLVVSFTRIQQPRGLRAGSIPSPRPFAALLPVPVTSRLGLVLGCGPGGTLGGILLVLVPQRACELMGDIMVVTTGLRAHPLGRHPCVPFWAAFLSAGA